MVEAVNVLFKHVYHRLGQDSELMGTMHTDQPTVSGLRKAAATNRLIDQLAMQAGTFSY